MTVPFSPQIQGDEARWYASQDCVIPSLSMLRKLTIRPTSLILNDIDLFTPARYPDEVVHPDDAERCEEQLYIYQAAKTVGEKSGILVRYLSTEDDR